jgi:hypothetical protein
MLLNRPDNEVRFQTDTRGKQSARVKVYELAVGKAARRARFGSASAVLVREPSRAPRAGPRGRLPGIAKCVGCRAQYGRIPRLLETGEVPDAERRVKVAVHAHDGDGWQAAHRNRRACPSPLELLERSERIASRKPPVEFRPGQVGLVPLRVGSIGKMKRSRYGPRCSSWLVASSPGSRKSSRIRSGRWRAGRSPSHEAFQHARPGSS